jgi:ribonuclease P protein component
VSTVQRRASGDAGRPTVAARLRFPRAARLLKHANFDQVYQQGRRLFSGDMTVFFLRRPEGSDGPRVGFTVGRVLGGAVVRNRIKRRMRDAVRQNLAQLKAPVDVVINPKKTVLKAEFAKLLEQVGRAFLEIQRSGSGSAANGPRSRTERPA